MTITDDDPVIGSLGQAEAASLVGVVGVDSHHQGTITPPELDPLAAMMADAATDDDDVEGGKAEATAEPLYSMPISREAENAVVDAVIQQQEQQQQLAESIERAAVAAVDAAAAADQNNISNMHTNKRKIDEATSSPPPPNNSNAVIPGWQAPGHRIGRWTLDEKLLFLYGLQKFGKGRWKKISTYVPHRSLIQIKSHAQKVLKRLDNGENVFRRLEENCSRLHYLVSQIHASLGLEEPPSSAVLQASSAAATTIMPSQVQQRPPPPKATAAPAAAAPASGATKRGRRRTTTKIKKGPDGTEHILAASALCQLGGESGSSANSVADGTEGETAVSGNEEAEVALMTTTTTTTTADSSPTAGDASAAKIAAAAAESA